MTITPTLAVVAALAAMLVIAVAERLHSRRVFRVARLAFGAARPPRRAMALASLLRILGAGAATWGLLFLAAWDPIAIDATPAKNASSHLLILLDVSPSMQLKDAGPHDAKLSRAARAGEVVQAILDRLDMESTRITIVAFYTDALPIVQDTFDKEVVRNALDGLPMYVAFEPGPTNLQNGLDKGYEIARKWPLDSATLVIITDGDVTATRAESAPGSIADTIVVGVGDSVRSMAVHGHNSRQETSTLKQVALRLGGTYHDGNVKHIPSEVIRGLTMVAPRIGGHWSLRDLAILLAVSGCSALAFATPLLRFLGRGVRGRTPATVASRTPSEAIA